MSTIVVNVKFHLSFFSKDLFLTHGWRTGAILEEVEVYVHTYICNKLNIIILINLKDEIHVINSKQFQKTIGWVNLSRNLNFNYLL